MITRYQQRFLNKPATSNASGLPEIKSKSDQKGSLINVEDSKNSSRILNSGVMSLSPFRNNIMSNRESPSRESRANSIYYKLANRNNDKLHKRSEHERENIIKMNKVKYMKTQQQMLDKFNSVLKNEDSRFIYIIPEGSDISSEDLIVIRINLTDYVRILLPKDASMMTNSKFKRMGPYEKLEAIKPSKALQNQIFKSILNILEVSWDK